MRIVSNFKDYYDVGMGQGQDLTLVYNRFPKNVEVEQFPFGTFNGTQTIYSRGSAINGFAVESHCVGFCGKFYPILGVKPIEYYGRNDKDSRAARRLCFDAEDVKNYVRSNFKDEQYEDFMSDEYNRKPKWPHHQKFKNIKQFFGENISPIPAARNAEREAENATLAEKRRKKWFDDNQCPVLVATCEENKRYHQGPFKVVLNGCLKDLEFYRKFDSFQAYQEIAMWLGNQAEPRKPIPKLDDVTMLESKGFDRRFSFRKPKDSEAGRK